MGSPSAPAPAATNLPLVEELKSIPAAVREKLDAHHFDAARLVSLAATLTDTGDPAAAEARRDKRNRVPGEVRPPAPGEILEMPPEGSPEHERLGSLGEEVLARGEVAFAVMAGGMATRMGGVVKALVEAIPDHTFLDLRLGENRTVSRRAGRNVPLWLMTSDATNGPIESALAAKGAPKHVRTFPQDLGLRLTPSGHLFRDAAGEVSTYATGHGDLVDALRRSTLLERFIASGGHWVWIANLDNLGATIDPVVLAMFVESGKDAMMECTDKVEGDKGGIPVHALGKLQVLEEFRLPRGFDASSVRVFSTNTLLVRATALASAPVAWNWFEVEKKVDGRPAVQFERLVQELTGALDATYVRVPREGAASRFLPVKDNAELALRRKDIAEIARMRGMF